MMLHTRTRFTLAMLLGAVLGAGCGGGRGDGDGDGGPATQTEITSACRAYCERAKLCDDETEISECEITCEDRMGGCMADEQRQAVDDLNVCAEDSCDDLKLCVAGAGLQCVFGL